MSKIFVSDIPFAYYEHTTYDLYYDEKHNFFTDEDGVVVCNIFSLIKPSDLYLFKVKRKDVSLPDVFGGRINLIWNN